MSNRQVYIEAYSKFIFYKYVYKNFLEQKYIEHFSKYEIKKMELIYQSMILDKEIENKFIYGIDTEFNHLKFTEILAKSEYLNLKKKISNMQYDQNMVSYYLKDIENRLNNDFMDMLKALIDKCDPFINKGRYTETMWNMIKFAVENGQFEVLYDSFMKLNKMDISKKRLSSKDLSEKIKYFDSEMAKIEELFPFNMEDILSSKRAINNKIEEIKTEIKKSDKALKHITNMYLYVNEYNGLEN